MTNSFTVQQSVSNATDTMCMGDRIVSATGTYSTTIDNTNHTTLGVTAIASFKAAICDAPTTFYSNINDAVLGNNVVSTCTLLDSFSISSSGNWILNNLKLGVNPKARTDIEVTADLYSATGTNIGTLIQNLVTNATFTGLSTQTHMTLNLPIANATLTGGGARYWIAIQDPQGTAANIWTWDDATAGGGGEVGVSGEFNAGNPSSSGFCFYPPTANNSLAPYMMYVALCAGAAPPPSPYGIGGVNSYGQGKAGYGINQKIIAIPEMNSFDEVRQVMARAIAEVQNHIATQLPILNYKQRKITNVAPPTEGDDVVTLKYLQSVQLPAQPKSQ